MKLAWALMLGGALSIFPQIGFAQTASKNSIPPTAESAAKQVGKSPVAAKTKEGVRIEPSQKLWNNPRTVSEQPGSMPPSNKTTNSPSKPTAPSKEEKSSDTEQSKEQP